MDHRIHIGLHLTFETTAESVPLAQVSLLKWSWPVITGDPYCTPSGVTPIIAVLRQLQKNQTVIHPSTNFSDIPETGVSKCIFPSPIPINEQEKLTKFRSKQGSSSSHAPTKWLETTLPGVYCQIVNQASFAATHYLNVQLQLIAMSRPYLSTYFLNKDLKQNLTM